MRRRARPGRRQRGSRRRDRRESIAGRLRSARVPLARGVGLVLGQLRLGQELEAVVRGTTALARGGRSECADRALVLVLARRSLVRKGSAELAAGTAAQRGRDRQWGRIGSQTHGCGRTAAPAAAGDVVAGCRTAASSSGVAPEVQERMRIYRSLLHFHSGMRTYCLSRSASGRSSGAILVVAVRDSTMPAGRPELVLVPGRRPGPGHRSSIARGALACSWPNCTSAS